MPTGSRSAPGVLTREVAAILRGQVSRLDLQQAVVGEAAGISQSQLSKVLRGEKQIDVDQLEALCWALGLDLLAVIKQADDATADRDRPWPDLLRDKGTAVERPVGDSTGGRIAARRVDPARRPPSVRRTSDKTTSD